MPDSRFYDALGPVALAELAELTGAVLAVPAHAKRKIEGVAPLARAGAGSIAFLGDRRYLRDLENTDAGACFITSDHADRAPPRCAVLIAAQPQAAYALAAARLHRPRASLDAVAIHPEAEIEPGAILAAGVTVGAGARIGAGTQIGANTVIGPGVAIGRGCRIGAGAVIGFALIGDEVRIFAGAVIGEPGFGVAAVGAEMIDVPQLGRVIVQDRVTIGANSCIDRGAWDDTVIGENTKIDNLVQIAHNVRIGRNCVFAAQTGISGSVVVGDGVMFGGRAGIADHLEIGAGAKIAAAAGVMKSVPAGEVWCGSPARPLRRFMRETAWVAKSAQARGEPETDD
ncbi:MAG TPA: UDP-3-O-(3-hydroxymyristoyl)glucosamine N-acyltransferase [Caulobacteraceae bacterium]|jgi:UDP-3-O-[3-hydroxymyristoyl] glucosamine N-acyltransferase|nr:UDP-3-O-(3-hydroxymyristoyl)glucosamine N-acyltransferase [Caulobacteraceae bacterium]